MSQSSSFGRTTPATLASAYSAAATAAADELIIRESRKRAAVSATKARGSSTAKKSAAEDGADGVVASVAFLLRMADNFALEGNLPESVKSAETALLVRRSCSDAVQRAVDRYHSEQARPPHRASRGGGDGEGSSAAECVDDADEAIVPASMDLQGKNLVLQCNSYAVAEFSHKRFDTAAFFLNKALFLTEAGGGGGAAEGSRRVRADTEAGEEGAETDTDAFLQSVQRKLSEKRASGAEQLPTEAAIRAAVTASRDCSHGSFCFSAAAEEDRLRLRAATLNNIGCMERRRGRLNEALGFLRKAIHMESQLDPTGAAASPSTYLNLCTVLNELHLHREAVAAAQNAVAALQQQLLEQVDATEKTRVAVMLMVAQYNLGVSLERRGERRDAEAAQRAYQQSLDTSRRYQLVAADCPTIDAAVAAVKRMKGLLPLTTTPQSRTLSSPHQARPVDSREGGQQVDPNATEWAAKLPAQPSDADAEGGACGADSIEAGGGRWAQAPDARLALPPSPPQTDAAHRAEQPPTRAPLTSTAPAALLSPAADTVLLASPPPRPAVPLSSSHVGPVSATWHPSHRTGMTPLAPHRTPPRTAAGLGGKEEGCAASTHSVSGSSLPSLPFSPPPPLPPPTHLSQRPSLNGGRGNVLLRPPRAPQHGGRSSNSSSRPQLPPTLAPLAGWGGADGVIGSTTSSVRSGGGGGPVPPGLRQSLSGVGRRVAPPLGGAGSISHGSLTGIVNPSGRRVFGSTTIHQHQQQQRALSDSPSSGLPCSGSGSGSPIVTKQQQALLQQQKEAARSKRMQEQQRKQAQREQERQLAAHDAQLADELYEQMIVGMEREQLHRCHTAAIVIQRVWRGVVARTWMRTMMGAASCLQRATRVFLVKVREAHRLAEEERQRQRAAQEARELAACRVLQARVRQFVRRLQIRREFIARQRRTFYAARTIQRGYRGYLTRKQQMLAALAEAHRREDAQRAFRRKVAARRIQCAFRQYQDRKRELAAAAEMQRRARAATRIQAVMRGVLTRAWFRYYRAYRHDQAMRSAASQRRITLMQAFCRSLLSAQHCQERRRELLRQAQQRRLALAATRIQGMWRQHVAHIHLERLRAERARADRQATILQRWYRARLARRAFVAHWDAKRRGEAATCVQRWVRALWMRRKERDFARYHVEKLREQRLMRLKQWAIPVMQACVAAKQSTLLVTSMQRSRERNTAAAMLWQRVARGYAGRQQVAFEKKMVRRVAEKERELATRTVAARVLQRAWRVASAKSAVEQRRRERLAATVLAQSYRCYLARKELHELRTAHQARRETQAACTLQTAWRHFVEKCRAQEMKAYYGAAHKKKLWRMRREEAAVTIQSLWRGHTTRQAMDRVLAEHQRLTRAAVTIQRAWRGIAQRQTLRATVAQRVGQRNEKTRAALRIQCFWRKMAAAERVAAMRQESGERARMALKVQCWWRQRRAERELARLRFAQAEEEALAALYAAKWERSASLVNAFLRCRQSRLHCVHTLHDTLLLKLRAEDQIRFRKRHRAATTIQRMYRGYYERCCYQGLLREKRERDRAAAAREAVEAAAALRIQCCYRRHRAQRERRERKIRQRERTLGVREDELATADPHQLVRELFWVRDLVQNRDSTAERVARARRHHNAAVTIQQAFRSRRAKRAAAAAADSTCATRAARTIAAYYARHRAAVAVKESQRREAAATRIQAYVRGWLVQRRWGAWRADLVEERRLRQAAADVLDAAATAIQSAWRRLLARREAHARRQHRMWVKESQARNEAAALIQEAFRAHRGDQPAPEEP